jgi:large subunit ribosomal protein L7A
MSYEKALQAEHVKIGTKQTLKVLETGNALEVFVAKDADPRVTAKVIQLCKKAGVTITYVDTMKMLGKACGIEVGAATAALYKE